MTNTALCDEGAGPTIGETVERFLHERHGGWYLEVRGRILLFRATHPDGYLRAELVRYDHEEGLAIFKAQAGYSYKIDERVTEEATDNGGQRVVREPIYREVYATGYGTETRAVRADFADGAETRAIGRALAALGFGTAQALDLDEGTHIVDSPISLATTAPPRRPPMQGAPPRALVPVEKKGTDDGVEEKEDEQGKGGGDRSEDEVGGDVVPTVPSELVPDHVAEPSLPLSARERVLDALLADPDARTKLPKGVESMSEEELEKTLTWLEKRARALAVTGSTLVAQSIVSPGAGSTQKGSLSPVTPPSVQCDDRQAPPDGAPAVSPTTLHWLGRAAEVAAWLNTYKERHPGKLPSGADLPEPLVVNLRDVYAIGASLLTAQEIPADPADDLAPSSLAPAIVNVAFMLCDHHHLDYPEKLLDHADALGV